MRFLLLSLIWLPQYELCIDILKMYLLTTSEVPTSRLSKVRVWKGQTHRDRYNCGYIYSMAECVTGQSGNSRRCHSRGVIIGVIAVYIFAWHPTVRIFNTHYIFTGKYIICIRYSDGGTPMRKCTWLWPLLSPRVRNSFWCWSGPCECNQMHYPHHLWVVTITI